MTIQKGYILINLLFLVFFGCATTKGDWEKAQRLNYRQSYQEFINKHPQSEFVSEARRQIYQLDWQKAKGRDTIESYQGFIFIYPQSEFAYEAKNRVENLQWEKVERLNTITSYQDFLKKYPSSNFSNEAKNRIEKLISDSFFIKVTAKDLKEVLISKEGAKAYFNTRHTFLDPVIIRQSKRIEKYEIKAMVASIDQMGRPVVYNLPFGPGTVYKLYGKVKMFGSIFISFENEPLIFLVHKPKDGGNFLKFLHINGSGSVVRRDGKEISLKK